MRCETNKRTGLWLRIWSGYGPTLFGNRPVRTRMRGAVGGRGETPLPIPIILNDILWKIINIFIHSLRINKRPHLEKEVVCLFTCPPIFSVETHPRDPYAQQVERFLDNYGRVIKKNLKKFLI